MLIREHVHKFIPSELLNSSSCFPQIFLSQIVAIAQVVLCSLKIDSGEYGKMQAENGLPEECLSADNNGTWWCKIIKNDDNSE